MLRWLGFSIEPGPPAESERTTITIRTARLSLLLLLLRILLFWGVFRCGGLGSLIVARLDVANSYFQVPAFRIKSLQRTSASTSVPVMACSAAMFQTISV